MARASIEAKTQLLVEGNDQRNFFEAFAEHLLHGDVQIRNFGGTGDLHPELSTFVKTPGFRKVESIGIVRDADASAQAAFQSVRSALTKALLPVPPAAAARSATKPAVSVLILPGGDRPGMLETLLHETFTAAENRCIDRYFECMRPLPETSLNKTDKARVHAWLATRPEPYVSAGVAAKKGYWDLDHAAFAGVRAFLAAL